MQIGIFLMIDTTILERFSYLGNLKMHILYPEILLLAICPNEILTYVYQKSIHECYSHVVIIVLLFQKGKKIVWVHFSKKMVHVVSHTMTYCTKFKGNELDLYTPTWMNFIVLQKKLQYETAYLKFQKRQNLHIF